MGLILVKGSQAPESPSPETPLLPALNPVAVAHHHAHSPPLPALPALQMPTTMRPLPLPLLHSPALLLPTTMRPRRSLMSSMSVASASTAMISEATAMSNL